VITLVASPSSGYQFLNWSDALSGSTNPTNITMSGNKSVTANFMVSSGPSTYTLTIPSSTGGSVNKKLNGTTTTATTFSLGTIVVLTAHPSTNYKFTGWSGDASGTTNPLSVVMSKNRTITPSFTPLPAACGTAAKSYAFSSEVFTGSFCTIGVPSVANIIFPKQGKSVTWYCKVGAQISPACTATRRSFSVKGT